MNNIKPLIITNIKNNLRGKAVIVIWYGTAVLLVIALIALFGILLIAPELEKLSPDKNKLNIYLGIILFSASLLSLGINLNALGFSSMVKEKSRGIIQSLMITPLRLKTIWLAKSLAIFIPGLIFCEILTVLTLIIVNLIYFVPTIGFLFNIWIFIICTVIFPAMYLCFGIMVYLIGLTGKPQNANISALVFLPLITNIMIQIPLRTTFMNFISWEFMLVNIGLVLIIAIIVAVLQSRISKEKVALSY